MRGEDYYEKRRKQTGMEGKHEKWVLSTLNFLAGEDIPFYTHGPDGERLPKEDKEIPERLQILKARIVKDRTAHADLRREHHNQWEALRKVQGELYEANLLIEELKAATPAKAAELLEALREKDKETDNAK